MRSMSGAWRTSCGHTWESAGQHMQQQVRSCALVSSEAAPVTPSTVGSDEPSVITYAEIDPATFDNDQKRTLAWRRPDLYGNLALFREEFGQVQERVAGLRRFGSAALDLAWVAAGRLDIYWERNLSPWDMAAGILLVREAGGFVLGRESWERHSTCRTYRSRS